MFGQTVSSCLVLAAMMGPWSPALGRQEVKSNFVGPLAAPTVELGTLGHVEQRGSGPQALILIPGIDFGWRVWDDFMQRNADRYTMYAITLPGFDNTPPPPTPGEVESFELHQWTDGAVSGIVSLIKSEGITRPIVVGHHLLGDHIALRLGLEYAELVSGVVVVAGEPSRAVRADMDGDPQLSEADHRLFVSRNLVPRLRTQGPDEASDVHVPAASLSRDMDRAAGLYERQVATPRYIEYRYFLEYMTTDLGLRLPSLTVPLVVIAAQGDADAMIERLVEIEQRKGLSEDDARRQVENMLTARLGSMDKARQQFGSDPAWERLKPQVPKLTVSYVEDTGIFIMDDQPKAFDQSIATFASTLADSRAPGSTP